MKSFTLLCVLVAFQAIFSQLLEARCEHKIGRPGPAGPVGIPGPSGLSFEINDVIKVTSQETGLVGNTFITFSSPVTFPTNGVDVPAIGGMMLVESVPASGNFDTITLPIETSDTFYLVTYGVSLGEISPPAEFQLVLNGAALPYTALGIDVYTRLNFSTRTSIIFNPSNVAGTLRFFAITPTAQIQPPTANTFSASINVVKLNNNGP